MRGQRQRRQVRPEVQRRQNPALKRPTPPADAEVGGEDLEGLKAQPPLQRDRQVLRRGFRPRPEVGGEGQVPLLRQRQLGEVEGSLRKDQVQVPQGGPQGVHGGAGPLRTACETSSQLLNPLCVGAEALNLKGPDPGGPPEGQPPVQADGGPVQRQVRRVPRRQGQAPHLIAPVQGPLHPLQPQGRRHGAADPPSQGQHEPGARGQPEERRGRRRSQKEQGQQALQKPYQNGKTSLRSSSIPTAAKQRTGVGATIPRVPGRDYKGSGRKIPGGFSSSYVLRTHKKRAGRLSPPACDLWASGLQCRKRGKR